MNRLEVAQKYQEVPPRDFLIWLCQIPEIIKNHELLQFIKDTLREFKRYASYSFISSVKGVFSRKSETGVAPDYYDYEKTDRFKGRMDILWKYMKIDSRYFSQTVSDNYDVLKKLCTEEELKNVHLDQDGNFVIEQDGEEVAVNVLSEEELKAFRDFINKDEKIRYKEIDGQLVQREVEEFLLRKKLREEKYHVVVVKDPIIKKFLAARSVERAAEQAQEQFGPEVRVETENVQDVRTEVFSEPEAKWEKIDQGKETAFKEKMMKISMNKPEMLSNINVRFSANRLLIAGKDKDGNLIVRIPKGFHDKGQKDFVKTGSSQYIGSYFKIPEDRVKFQKDGSVYFTGISLDEKFELCNLEKDSEGKVIDITAKRDSEGRVLNVPAVTIAQQFKIAEIKITNGNPQNHKSVMIDGEAMERVTTDSGYTFAFSKGEEPRAVILKYVGNEKDIRIPGKLNVNGQEYPVTEIKDAAFEKCGAEKVTIPAGIKEIRNCAFSNCPALKEITINEGVTSIGDYAFENTGITGLKIPSTVQSVGNNIVADCKNLKEIICTNNENLRSIDGVLFDKGTLYAYPIGREDSAYIVPSGTTEIGDSAFKNCKLESVSLPETVKSVGNSGFENSEKLSLVEGGGNLSEIGNQAFVDCHSLDAFDLTHVKTVGRQAFMNTPIKDIRMDDVLDVREEAFKNNMKLESFTLNSQSAQIDISAFNNCPLKTEISGTMAPPDYLMSKGVDVEPVIEKEAEHVTEPANAKRLDPDMDISR